MPYEIVNSALRKQTNVCKNSPRAIIDVELDKSSFFGDLFTHAGIRSESSTAANYLT